MEGSAGWSRAADRCPHLAGAASSDRRAPGGISDRLGGLIPERFLRVFCAIARYGDD